MMAIGGLAILAAAFALLRSFRPRPGEVVRRSELADTTVAILFTAGLSIGTIMTVLGVVALWPL